MERSLIEQTLEQLALKVAQAAAPARRYMLGIAGCCGSGKSTLAEKLAGVLSSRHGLASQVVAMDGFHLTNAELEARGLRPVKGSPPTYDAGRFIDLLRRLRQSPDQMHTAPVYSRKLHEPVMDAQTLGPETRVVIVEGNYLLLDEEPWRQARPLLDEVWFLEVEIETCLARVRGRHMRGGSDAATADAKIARNDRPNAQLIWNSRAGADQMIRARLADFSS